MINILLGKIRSQSPWGFRAPFVFLILTIIICKRRNGIYYLIRIYDPVDSYLMTYTPFTPKHTHVLGLFFSTHKEYISLSYWSVNADKKGWGSVVSTLLYCSIDGNPRKKYPFWYVSPSFSFSGQGPAPSVRTELLSNTWSASSSFVTIFFPYRHSTSEFPTLTF